MRKKIFLALTTLLIVSCSSSFAQTCKVTCIYPSPKNKSENVPIPFTLTFVSGKGKISFNSDSRGVMYLDKKEMSKFKNEFIESFDFQDKLNHEFYGTPGFLYHTKRRLRELCGVTLTVDKIW